VIELRARNWISRRKEDQQKPIGNTASSSSSSSSSLAAPTPSTKLEDKRKSLSASGGSGSALNRKKDVRFDLFAHFSQSQEATKPADTPLQLSSSSTVSGSSTGTGGGNNRGTSPPADMSPRGRASSIDSDSRSRIRGFVSEFFVAQDLNEVATCVLELSPSCPRSAVVYEGMLTALEAKDNERVLFSRLIIALVKSRVLNNDQVKDAISALCSSLSDLSIDLPRACEQLGAFTADMIREGFMTFSFFSSILPNISESADRLRFGVALVRSLKQTLDERSFAAILQQDSTSWVPIMGSAAEVTQELKRANLMDLQGILL